MSPVEIPQDVHDSAARVVAWAEGEHVEHWRIAGVADIRLIEDYERVLLSLGVTHVVAGPGGDTTAHVTALRESDGEPVGMCEVVAGERWVCPLINHDGSNVVLGVKTGEDGKRKLAFTKSFTPMSVGLPKT